ncbi:MAG: response regulator [Oscillospiraceae bacterium]|nr:response regulator [Oscillospiraceae bacterium]
MPDRNLREKEKLSMTAPTANILVVDDNVFNLRVAGSLLCLFKIRADFAESGKEGINLVKRKDYDIVFIDHMMPDMNGVETVAEIRKLGEPFTHLPIIALTANAVKGTKEMFLASGFNDFISKPVDLQSLGSMLSTWLPPNKITKMTEPKNDNEEKSEKPPAVSSPSHCDGQPVNIPGINTHRGLSLYNGDLETFLDVVRIYAQDIPAELGRLSDVSEANLQNYAIDAHTVKGASAGIGARNIFVRAKELEALARDGDFAAVSAKNEEFIKDTRILIKNINAWFSQNDTR